MAVQMIYPEVIYWERGKFVAPERDAKGHIVNGGGFPLVKKMARIVGPMRVLQEPEIGLVENNLEVVKKMPLVEYYEGESEHLSDSSSQAVTTIVLWRDVEVNEGTAIRPKWKSKAKVISKKNAVTKDQSCYEFTDKTEKQIRDAAGITGKEQLATA